MVGRRKFAVLLFILASSSAFRIKHVPLPKLSFHNRMVHSTGSVDAVSYTPLQSENHLLRDMGDAFNKLSNNVKYAFKWPGRKTMQFKDYIECDLPMLKYLWPEDNPRLRLYLVLSLVFMFFGKWFNLRVPFILQYALDSIKKTPTNSFHIVQRSFIMYGLARALSVGFAELKTCLFVRVSQDVLRRFANQIFQHLHALDSSFHLSTPSGVISVAYVRAVKSQTHFRVFILILIIVFSVHRCEGFRHCYFSCYSQ